MEKLLNKITNIATYLIILLGVFFTLWTITKGDNLAGDVDLQSSLLNPYFALSAIALIIALAATILFPIGQMLSNPKSAIGVGISIAVLALIYILSWSMATGETDASYYQTFDISSNLSRFIGSLIYVVYILGVLSILSVIGSGIYGALSKK